MSLRDQNPMIDSDLELIITTFEKATSKSRDADSVFIPFRRQVDALANYPRSIISSIDGIPSPSIQEDSNVASEKSDVPNVTTPEGVVGNTNSESDDTTDDEEWTEKVKDWASECIPCTGDFKRTISSMDAEFFKDIADKWDVTLNESLDKLTKFEDLLEGGDPSLAFCDLGSALKGQCLPDIKKMIFILSNMLSRMEYEFSLDLSIVDSFLTAALSPIFNEMAANLDLIDTLALQPIRCVLDNIQYQINNAPQIADQARAAIVDPVRKHQQEQRERINAALRQNAQNNVNSNGQLRSEAEIAAKRAQLDRLAEEQRRSNREQMTSALSRANQAFNRAQQSLNFLDKFQEYITTGADYLEDKKEWLLNLIEEFVNDGLDKWNDNMVFAESKTDILTFLSIMKAMVDAAKNGDISCGSESDGMTSEDVSRIVSFWQHPAESLEITVEGDNIVTRRIPELPSNEESGNRGLITGNGDIESAISNVVVRRPISSCLKKVTTDEAEQVQYWIAQLEQEV